MQGIISVVADKLCALLLLPRYSNGYYIRITVSMSLSPSETRSPPPATSSPRLAIGAERTKEIKEE